MSDSKPQPSSPAARPQPFPHDYEVTLDWKGPEGGVLEAPPRPAIVGGQPPQFLGKQEWWSPEHLLLAATSLCLMTTFQAFAQKDKLEVARYGSVIKGILDKTREGLRFTSIVIHVDLAVPAADVEKAEKLLYTAKQYCIVSAALKTPLDLRVYVSAA